MTRVKNETEQLLAGLGSLPKEQRQKAEKFLFEELLSSARRIYKLRQGANKALAKIKDLQALILILVPYFDQEKRPGKPARVEGDGIRITLKPRVRKIVTRQTLVELVSELPAREKTEALTACVVDMNFDLAVRQLARWFPPELVEARAEKRVIAKEVKVELLSQSRKGGKSEVRTGQD